MNILNSKISQNKENSLLSSNLFSNKIQNLQVINYFRKKTNMKHSLKKQIL